MSINFICSECANILRTKPRRELNRQDISIAPCECCKNRAKKASEKVVEDAIKFEREQKHAEENCDEFGHYDY